MCHYVGAKWLSWVVCVCVYVGWVLLAVQVWKCVGGERCVDLETQKEGKKSTPKGREAEVTSTVRERSHANNARVLCLECQLKTSLAKPRTRVSTAFFVFLSVDANSIE